LANAERLSRCAGPGDTDSMQASLIDHDAG